MQLNPRPCALRQPAVALKAGPTRVLFQRHRGRGGLPATFDDSILFLDNGEGILFPRKRKDEGPSFDLSREEALRVQLGALKFNEMNGGEQWADYGIEVMYRFADFDPFERSRYFGRSLDLGQFERFRRVMHAPPFATLLCHEDCTWLSSLEVDEHTWKQRLHVSKGGGRDERIFEFTMSQRLGGRYDGFWFTSSLLCDESSDAN